MAVTVAQFFERLATSGILTAADLAALRESPGAQDAAGDAEPLAKRLHKEGRLTGYQVQALWKGKGQQLALGNYVIEDELGRGGMGVVLKARHKRMQRHVAIKVLPTAMVKDAAAIARFQREVVAAAKLTHTNIVGAFDADEINGQHILVMEFVDGRDLSSIVKKQGPLPVPQAIDCVIQAARGLEFAHKQGVIHRDIKPANLLLDAAGTVKILDMGLARLSGAGEVAQQAELTGTGTVMGTVDYMSPEQALSTKTADHRADIYSLGITLHYLLTGQPAYPAESLTARLMAHANSPIPALAAARGAVPPQLQTVFEGMVAKKVADRYQSMTDVIADLEACRSDASGTATLVRPKPASAAESSDKLSAFLSQLNDVGSSGTAVTKAAVLSGSRTRTVAEMPTLVTQAEVGTQPSVTASQAERNKSRRKASAAKPPLWQDWRVLAGGGGLLALLAVLVITVTSRDADPLPAASPVVGSAATLPDVVTVGQSSGQTAVEPAAPGTVPVDLSRILASPDYVWSEPENLGPGINTSAEDDLAGLSEDELTIYVHRDKHTLLKSERARAHAPFPPAQPIGSGVTWDDQLNVSANGLCWIGLELPDRKGRELWMSRRPDRLSDFPPPERMPELINTGQMAHPVQSPDGLTLLATGVRGDNNGQLWMFTRPAIDQPFDHAELLPAPVNTPAWDMPSYISSARRLLITLSQADRSGTTTRRPLLFTRARSDEAFGEPKYLDVPLGQAADSTRNGRFTLSGDGRSVYFVCSQLPGGAGQADIWVSRRVPASARPTNSEAVSGPSGEGTVIDLLSQVRLPDDELKSSHLGSWTRDGAALVSPSGRKWGMIGTRIRPPLEYELTAVLERVTGKDGVQFGINVAGRHCKVGIDVYSPPRAGIEDLDGQKIPASEASIPGPLLPDFRQYTIQIRVRARSVELLVDGERKLFWEGDPARLYSDQGGEDPLAIQFGASYDQFKFHKVELRPLAPVGTAATAGASAPASIGELLTSPEYEWTAPENLGPGVNTEWFDEHPSLSADGLTLWFSSGGEVWTAKRSDASAPFTNRQSVGRVLNDGGSWDSAPEISANGLELYLQSGRGSPGGDGNLDLFVARRSALNAPFSVPERLPTGINSAGPEGGPCLSADGLTLVFSSAQPEGSGAQDLWQSTRPNRLAEFAPSVNLGPQVNCDREENDPCLSADGTALLFASARSGARERTDLFISTRSDSRSPWGPPVSLGPVVNSAEIESAPALAPDGRTLYFYSHRPGGQGKADLWLSRRVRKATTP